MDQGQRLTLQLIVFTGLSWLGFVTHNFADLPGQTLLSPETLPPTVIYLLLVAAWFSPGRRVTAWLLLGWASLQLLGGGILSVLPIPRWPFDPAQTVYHYGFHILYTVTQLPLIIFLIRYLRNTTAYETTSLRRDN